MHELRNLRINSEYDLESFAQCLRITVPQLVAIEQTPIERLTVGDVSQYLDALALDIEVLATTTGATEFQRRLVPDPLGLVLFDGTSVGEDVQTIEHGQQILRQALEGDLDR